MKRHTLVYILAILGSFLVIENATADSDWCGKIFEREWNVIAYGEIADHLQKKVVVTRQMKGDYKVRFKDSGNHDKWKTDDKGITVDCTAAPEFRAVMTVPVEIDGECWHEIKLVIPYIDSIGDKHYDQVAFGSATDHRTPSDKCTDHLGRDADMIDIYHLGTAHGTE